MQESESVQEKHLVRLAQRGNRDALCELVTLYDRPLYGYFIGLCRNKADSEDLTQETLLKMVTHIEKYRALTSAKFSTWLFRIAHNVFIDSLRRKKPTELLEETILSTDDVEGEFLTRLNAQFLRKAIEKLPADMREMVILRYFAHHSYKEIAQVLDIQEKRVKWKLHDALEKLKQAYNEEEN